MESLDRLRSVAALDASHVDSIQEDLRSFSPDLALLNRYLGSPSLEDGGYGTHFIISPTSDSLVASLERPPKGEMSQLVKLLVGFSNTMIPGYQEPQMRIAFRDHIADDEVVSITDETEFFTPADFSAADHRVRGGFDESGRFSGEVEVYGREPINYEIPPPRGVSQRRSRCGAFTFNMAALQGQAKESAMSPEAYGALDRKTNGMGGLYVYRDGIRVLPYGNPDFDFLEIEKRRTLGASYYYFSHRNLFGTIEISRDQNPGLIDKAGREGLQENRGYGEFRQLLKNLFLQLAGDFFRKDGERSSLFLEQRDRLKSIRRAQEEHENRSKKQRSDIEAQLYRSWGYIQSNELEAGLSAIKSLISDQLAKPLTATSLARTERASFDRLRNVRARLTIREPEGVALGPRLGSQVEDLHVRVGQIETDLIGPLEAWIEQSVSEAASTLAEHDTANWLRNWAEGVIAETKLQIDPLLDSVSEELRRLQSEQVALRIAIEDDLTRLRQRLDESLSELARNGCSRSAMISQRLGLVTDLDRWAGVDEALSADQALLKLVNLKDTPSADRPMAALRAFEEEVLAQRDRAQLDMEMIQLGMAVEVLSHEFDDSIRAVRNNIRRLSAWANANPELVPLFENLSAAFAHLDGYLRLLTPLSRRLYRNRTKITGKDIHRYVQDMFSERLNQQDVELQVSKEFEDFEVESFRSTLYPVFVNLIDNSLYWLRDNSQPRIVRLDAIDSTIRVSDTGPGITERDREWVFERGMSRKPYGRGLGLYISQQVLAEEGFVIEAVESNDLGGACFQITRRPAE